ncbi:hypothetical protein BYT27DRAFT_7199730, partial [Phlegmacium glaucopus]
MAHQERPRPLPSGPFANPCLLLPCPTCGLGSFETLLNKIRATADTRYPVVFRID